MRLPWIVVLWLIARTFAGASEASLVLNSSHVMVVQVDQFVQERNRDDYFKVTPKMVLKGVVQPSQATIGQVTIALFRSPELPHLVEGKAYVVFVDEMTRDDRIVYVGGYRDAVEIEPSSLRVVTDRIEAIVRSQRNAISQKLGAIEAKLAAHSDEIDGLISSLFHEGQAEDAAHRLLLLPDDKLPLLAWRVYDMRPIVPQTVTFTFRKERRSNDLHIDCVCVQDIILGVLSKRLPKHSSPAYPSTASLARRTTMADSWFYTLVCQGEL